MNERGLGWAGAGAGAPGLPEGGSGRPRIEDGWGTFLDWGMHSIKPHLKFISSFADAVPECIFLRTYLNALGGQ